jgi:photosystem II stability/assembly factor-like uncharacterized protein
MKRFLPVFLLVIIFISEGYSQIKKSDVSISVDTIFTAKISIRAVVPEKNRIWYAADEGRFGYYDFRDNTTFEKRIVFDTLKPEFRSMAETSGHVFILGIGSPALLYKIDKGNPKPKLVCRDTDPKIFYDSMKFWNDKEGMAVGDPIDHCFTLLITRDGGDSWNKISCADIPQAAEGEGAFAASNTNIILKGNKAWIVSGGKKARVFYSADKGKTWTVYNTPILQGEQMTGIYTGDFYDEQTGFIAGGNYDKPEMNSQNKAITHDGGKTWTLVADNAGFGYASCIQFVPGSDGKALVSLGATGLWYSADAGLSWEKLLEDKTLFTIKFLDSKTAYAAGKNKIIRIVFKK